MRVVHVLRKPLSEGTVARNVVKHCAGGINIDASRVGTHGEVLSCSIADPYHAKDGSQRTWNPTSTRGVGRKQHVDGRWPANVILAHLAGCVCEGTKRVEGRGAKVSDVGLGRDGDHTNGIYGAKGSKVTTAYVAEDGKEVVAAWNCERGCPVKALDEQSGTTASAPVGVTFTDTLARSWKNTSTEGIRRVEHGDSGGASRFFKQIGGSE